MTETKTTATTETRGCACGCGEPVERTFKQGHDQKLVSKLAADVVHGSYWDGRCMGILKRVDDKADMEIRINKVSAYVGSKLSEALATKFDSAARRQWDIAVTGKERADAKAARRAENAAKPKRAKKTEVIESGAAQVASEIKNDRVGKVVTATASNDDVDAEEASASPNGQIKPGDSVRIKAGKRTRTATVRGMNQAGKVTAVAFMNAGKEVVKTEGQFEIVN